MRVFAAFQRWRERRSKTPIVPMKGGSLVAWMVAIMVMVSVVALAGGLAIGNLAKSARAELSGAVVVQLTEANRTLRERQLERIAAILESDPAVEGYRVVPEEELAELIEPWLGPAARSGEIPIPALVDVQLRAGADAVEIGRLRAALEPVSDKLRVEAQSRWLAPVQDTLQSLRWLAIGLAVLFALCLSAAVWLASRSTFASHFATVELAHLLGGSDGQIASFFVTGVARDAIVGAAIGLGAGIATVAILGRQFARLDAGLMSFARLEAFDYALLVMVALAAVLIALLVARLSVVIALRRMP